MEKPEPCLFCGSNHPDLQRVPSVFQGQDYGDRYPPHVTRQSHGFRVRCEGCGNQTCYWHYEAEAIAAWNRRAITEGGEEGCLT